MFIILMIIIIIYEVGIAVYIDTYKGQMVEGFERGLTHSVRNYSLPYSPTYHLAEIHSKVKVY